MSWKSCYKVAVDLSSRSVEIVSGISKERPAHAAEVGTEGCETDDTLEISTNLLI